MPGVCPRCLREVYFAEEKLALGKVWHTFCFSCRNCRKLLDSCTVETHAGELFCRNCYNRLFSTTCVRPSLPMPINVILPSVDKKGHASSPCGSLSDCCCCHYDETCPITDATNENPESIIKALHCPSEKRRLRGGGGYEEERRNIVEEPPRRTFGQIYRNHLRRKPVAIAPSIDSRRRQTSYPPPRPLLTPPLSRRRVSFLRTANFPSGSPTTYYPAMQNNVANGSGTVDAISFEHSGVCVESDEGNDESDSATADSQIGNNQDSDGIDDCEEDFRMRGGCGGGGSGCGGGGSGCGGGGSGHGGGGSGCGCGSSRGPDHPRQSPCSARYQSERSSPIEDACGCSGLGSGGCGSNSSSRGGCGGRNVEAVSSNSPKIGGCCGPSREDEDSHEGPCASKFSGGCHRSTGHERCPPRSPESCTANEAGLTSCSAVACSPPCADRKGCCPPAGCKPVRRRVARCNAPCTAGSQGCGGGGSCGSGCRGGCGKPGQTCQPLRPCTIPPCQPHPRGGGSPCAPPRGCPPQPPCCRTPVIPGTLSGTSGTGGYGGSSCCRSKSPGVRSAGGGGCANATGCQQHGEAGSCYQTKVPAGCECLGGGQDCQRCGRKVYHAEMQMVSGAPYHNICFSCFCCRKPLETLTYHENCGEIYCKQCYVRNFGPQGYGYAGVLQTPM